MKREKKQYFWEQILSFLKQNTFCSRIFSLISRISFFYPKARIIRTEQSLEQPLEHFTQHIEALIFGTDVPISFEDIRKCLQETLGTRFQKEEVKAAIESLIERYRQEMFAIELVEISDGYQFLTKGAYHSVIATFLKQTTKKRLSRSAMETLSIIAYKQPVTKGDLESIRGVGCDYSIQKLLEKELVSILGRSEGPGRPLLYGTSSKFMDYFGLKNLKDLPKPKDFKEPESEIGEQAPIEESFGKKDESFQFGEAGSNQEEE